MTLTADDFAAWLKAVHGEEPFPWQQRLVEHLARKNQWPEILDLPTGAGKTATLDAAVFHLALQVDAPQRAALRIVMAVDRHLVVDDAHHRARKIAGALRDPTRVAEPGRAVVEEVARRLRRRAGAGEDPLVAVRLRGGAPLEHDWARTPTGPTILCSTVDQVGSRLLFRGYGVSDRMKPVHAGLLGEDSLILLDEAHLSQPFWHTLQAVREVGGATVTATMLTATPDGSHERRFGLGPQDDEHLELSRRFTAAKPAKLMKPIRSLDPASAFTRVARGFIKRLRRDGLAAPAVGVVVNRIDLARAIFSRLHETEDAPFECLLMIGRSRDIARRRAESMLAPFRTGVGGRNQAETPLMVVATQCLEVGVDLDLDGLVTQAASLDALRQRFGRLNRAGRPIPAAGAILVTTDSLAKKANDPVYGDRIRPTWDALTGISRNDSVDFGVAALDEQLRKAEIDVATLAAPPARAPVVMPAYLDLWSHTSPPPAADPEVGLFLHGTERAATEVSLVWRSDISEHDLAAAAGVDRLKRILELVRPRSAEMLDVPIWAAKGWLRRWNTARAAGVADVTAREDDLDVDLSGTDRRAFRWAGVDDPRTGPVSAGDLQPGDVLVVPADYGGCDDYGWAPQDRDRVADVADDAAWPYRGRRLAVRVTPDVALWDRLAATLPNTDEDLDLDALLAVLPDAGDEEPPEPDRRDVRRELEALREATGGTRRIDVHRPYGSPDRGAVLVAEHGTGGAPAACRPGAQPATEDESLSYTSARPVTLDDHTDSVVAHVDRFTAALRFDQRFDERTGPQLAADLRLAATLHDIGKADPRFQLFLMGADRWNWPDGPPLAKSGRPGARDAWERADLPARWRHEARSVTLATVDARFSEAHDPHLVLWLIGTHHGFGRPFFGFADPHGNRGPQSLAYDFGGLGWPALFDRLSQRYGIWRLAWLETILRLADHRASEAVEASP